MFVVCMYSILYIHIYADPEVIDAGARVAMSLYAFFFEDKGFQA